MNDKKQEIMDIQKRRNKGVLFLVIILVSITIGFALLSTTSNINGKSKIINSVWDVHFSNIMPNTGSVTPTVPATIDSDGLIINYSVVLDQPGDFYEFTVDVVNSGTIDAKLSALPTITGVSPEQDVYVNYTFKHADGSSPVVGEEIAANGGSETFKVRIEYDDSILPEQLPETDQVLNLEISMIYQQK